MIHSGKISEHFYWNEVENSDTAERLEIDNGVPGYLIPAAEKTALFMEMVRECVDNKIIYVNSWYRCAALQALPQFYNPTSQHPRVEAVDFTCPDFGTPKQIAQRLLKEIEFLQFDQLILEHSWVHVSKSSNPNASQRRQVLTLLSNKKYAIGLTDRKGVPI